MARDKKSVVVVIVGMVCCVTVRTAHGTQVACDGCGTQEKSEWEHTRTGNDNED